MTVSTTDNNYNLNDAEYVTKHSHMSNCSRRYNTAALQRLASLLRVREVKGSNLVPKSGTPSMDLAVFFSPSL